jgi:hypothetical protein
VISAEQQADPLEGVLLEFLEVWTGRDGADRVEKLETLGAIG